MIQEWVQLALEYGRVRRLYIAAVTVAALLIAAPLWADGRLPVFASTGGATIRGAILAVLVVSLVLGRSLEWSLGDVERVRPARLRSLRIAHATVAAIAVMAFQPVLANYMGRQWGTLAAANGLGLLGLYALAVALRWPLMPWLIPTTLVLVMWMFGTDEPANVARWWAWMLQGEDARVGSIIGVALASAGLVLWVQRGPDPDGDGQ